MARKPRGACVTMAHPKTRYEIDYEQFQQLCELREKMGIPVRTLIRAAISNLVAGMYNCSGTIQ